MFILFYSFYDYELYNAATNSRTMKIEGIFCVDLMFLVHTYIVGICLEFQYSIQHSITKMAPSPLQFW